MNNKSILAHTLPIVAMICFILAWATTNDKMFLWLTLFSMVMFICVLISYPFIEYIKALNN